MCIHMLTKRAQILFDEKTYTSLEELADAKGTSVGELVRTAVEKTYPATKRKKSISVAEAIKDTFGGWADDPRTDEELMRPLAYPWAQPRDVFGNEK